ncbi:hypothetical protein CEXT_460831 [Caerostris extrusa]|uniref:Uncharacterized protein n=1 Tax=Caerostris extrusa TaxID=172846 RepID=A0AAV4TN92_CAEEX|nr:hypothetical protein CEXT_460831 [Caerostris extrusa]
MVAVIASSEEYKYKGIEYPAKKRDANEFSPPSKKHVVKHTKATSPTKKLPTKSPSANLKTQKKWFTTDTPSASKTSRRPPV